MAITQLERIVNRFEVQPNGCWWHPTTPTAKGFAQTKYGWPVSKSTLIHRLSWMYYKGDIPEGMVIDHTCHDPKECKGGNTCLHRRCVNPEHLQLVTSAENSYRSVRVLEHKTHCKRGHELENNIYTYNSKNSRRSGCATCMNRKVVI